MKLKNIFLIGLACLVSATSLKALDNFNAISMPGTAVNLGTNYVIIPGEGFLSPPPQYPYTPGQAPLIGETIINFLSVRAFATATPATLVAYYSTNRVALVATNTLGSNNAAIFTGTTTNYIALYQAGGATTNTTSSATGITNANEIFVLHHLSPVDWRQADEYLTGGGNAAATVQVTNQSGAVIVLQPVVFQQTPSYPVRDGDILYQQTAGASILVPSTATAAGVSTALTITGNSFAGGKAKPFLMILSSSGVGTNSIDAASAVAQ